MDFFISGERYSHRGNALHVQPTRIFLDRCNDALTGPATLVKLTHTCGVRSGKGESHGAAASGTFVAGDFRTGVDPYGECRS